MDKADLQGFRDAMDEAMRTMYAESISVGSDPTFKLQHEVKVIDGMGRPGPSTEKMRAWCQQLWLAPWDIDNISGVWCYDRNGVFNFKHEKDRTIFLLRWT